MALPILDGNQTAATLSTIVSGGSHIPAHTVVSLGSQAITDITSAVSGISVSIGGTQTTTFGAITGSVSVLNFPASQSVSFGATTGSVSVLNFPATQTVAGTVTANVPALNIDTGYPGSAIFGVSGLDVNAVRTVLYSSSGNGFNSDDGRPVDIDNPLPISGTVTANVGGIASGVTLPVRLFAEREGTAPTGEDTLVVCNSGGRLLVDATASGASVVDYDGQAFVRVKMTSASSVTIGSLPSGALTTRFGSVATANLAFITSAVTNTSRKYLLAQNISAGTVTIGIGFSPTTTQGIQLTSGAGLTFDSFCPTGAVYWLGAVTGAAFTILEG